MGLTGRPGPALLQLRHVLLNFGADLYRFVPSTGALTKNHNTFDGIPSLAFNPANPKILYLGLAEER
ncbi:hypothetical protein [Kribbella sp. VKM Ac-2566]|uniref:hypothetical protein n=1 Tax=Kribbella sp. VKM Ac-2566 TaxID=2512218 RepID=UPI001063164F|nr:hypothetical protein [Kribbella sp. VKM Ac-2566]TDW91434.1 hypothetical protein EV647_5013 [Kribbella sp. VKM Ac-2566]